MRFTLVLATLALSTVAFAQIRQDGAFQIGYAANLNIGDSVLNLSNDGINGGVFGAVPPTRGNICANIYVFDPQEEEIGCCSCLITPNGLNSLSAKSDLISNNLTPAVPTSIVVKVIGSTPSATAAVTAGTGTYTVCNPATLATANAAGPAADANGITVRQPTNGLMAWGTTLEPSASPGTFNTVNVPYLNAGLSSSASTSAVGNGELEAVTALCNFIQANGTGFGICKSCRLGALGGAKQ